MEAQATRNLVKNVRHQLECVEREVETDKHSHESLLDRQQRAGDVTDQEVIAWFQRVVQKQESARTLRVQLQVLNRHIIPNIEATTWAPKSTEEHPSSVSASGNELGEEEELFVRPGSIAQAPGAGG